MNDRLRSRFWLETALALMSGALAVITVLWRDWIEIVFGIDPDRHSGSLEWTIVSLSVAILAAAATLAYREWCRPVHVM